MRLRLVRDRHGRSRLAERCQRYPLTMTAVLPLDDEPGALVYVQNAAGSVFGGDRLHVDVALETGAALCLSTPSATRLQGAVLSVQTTRVSVAEGARFESMPDLLIPHPDAQHRQQTSIDLGAGATAIVAEMLAPGRVARGERHAYRSIALRLQASHQGRPFLHDAATLRPDEAAPALAGSLAAEGYVGTLFALAPHADPDALAEGMNLRLAAIPGVYAAASPLAGGQGAVARVLAREAPLLRQAMHAAWDAARRCLHGRPAPVLRK